MVFARLPRAGEVKTRLIPVLGRKGAEKLYGAFLDDTIHMARQIDGVTRALWVVRHPDAIREMQGRYVDFAVREQPSGDLGNRMRRAFEHAFGERVDYAVIVGSDHPTLPASYVRRAFDALKGAHLVLGPTEDGGYYAIGLRRYAWPLAAGLFADIAWSTPAVLTQTRHRASTLGLCHVELPTWYDVDEPHQLARLVSDADPDSATMRALQALDSAAVPEGRGTVPRLGEGGGS
jgi:rSAM/selenodomain-associated transferase 1